MDAADIARVQLSFEHIVPNSSGFTAVLYRRLRELDPTLPSLFLSDMVHQERRFWETLGVIVTELSHPDVVLPYVRALGQGQKDAGVRSQHYASFGVALLASLRECLGQLFTPEVEVAWARAYALVADTLQAGALNE